LRAWGFDLRVEHTDYGTLAHSDANRENPCFLCARLRRKRIFEIADETGCNKVAFGHHKDDIIETFFLNVCYSGNISTMRPAQSFFGGKITVIRPLAYVDEDRIRQLARKEAFPEFYNPCPRAAVSKRKEIKDMLHRLYRSNKKIKGNVFSALKNVNPDYLL
jgi:tRNA 2-thiocytidine biosynthesis protein TtcA